MSLATAVGELYKNACRLSLSQQIKQSKHRHALANPSVFRSCGFVFVCAGKG
jgi:hypothetical protein